MKARTPASSSTRRLRHRRPEQREGHARVLRVRTQGRPLQARRRRRRLSARPSTTSRRTSRSYDCLSSASVRFGGEHKTLAAGERADRRALLLLGDPNELDDKRRLGRIGLADRGDEVGLAVPSVPGGAGSCRGSRRTPLGLNICAMVSPPSPGLMTLYVVWQKRGRAHSSCSTSALTARSELLLVPRARIGSASRHRQQPEGGDPMSHEISLSVDFGFTRPLTEQSPS